jgi:hypothetical protein
MWRDDRQVNNNVMITTNHFIWPARERVEQNPRSELISEDGFVQLINEYLGLGSRCTLSVCSL